MSVSSLYSSAKCLVWALTMFFIVMSANAYAQGNAYAQNLPQANGAEEASPLTSPLTMVNGLYERLRGGSLKDIYKEIDRLKERAKAQEGLEKYQTLGEVLSYSFWLDDGVAMKNTLQQMQGLDLPSLDPTARKTRHDLYFAYAEMVGDADYKASRDAFEQGIAEGFAQGDVYSQAIAYEMLGVAEAFFGNYFTGVEKLQFALRVLDGHNDMNADRVRVGIYLAFAYVYTSLDHTSKAVDYYIKALDLSLKNGFAVDHGGIIYNTGFLLLQNKNLDEAELFFNQLLMHYTKVGDPENLTYPYYALAFIYYHRGEHAVSQSWAEKAYVYGQYITDFEGTLLQLMAENSAWLGKMDKAYDYLGDADAYFEEYPDYKGTTWEARSIRVRAVIAHAEGRHGEAIKTYEQFHQAYYKAQNQSFASDVGSLTSNLFTRLDSERAESDLLRNNMAVEQLNLKNQRYVIGFIAFLLLIMLGLFLFQLRWSKMLQASKMDAEQASRSKSEFLAQMSHELRTPLNAIIGFSEMMSKEVLGELANKKYKDYVVLINQSGLHLLRIINDILDISKVESGKLELLESEFDLCVLIDETVETMQNRAARVDVEIVNTAPEKCSMLNADRRIVKQVLFNIISNSIKFTQRGGKISISYKVCESGEIIIDVTDNGQGMSPEHLRQALEPFGQVKQVMVQSHEGTGLGLPLVQAFMELHQGDMNISSKLGDGTTVELMFPAARVV